MQRRRFLLTVLGVGGVTAAARRRDPKPAQTATSMRSGYRETDHVRRYYQTARES